ncbi:hypothetical protein U91I_01486 [alpha proteobacterium U9-1i]|nr:hypothetical protein U91I_01486 [alpha proteobacterium U9-1i]
MRFPNLLAFLSLTFTNQPALTPEITTYDIVRRHDYGDRNQALIDEWNAMRAVANAAADFYRRMDKPSAKTPRAGDPRQSQFYDEPFIKAAAFFRRAGSDIATGEADPARLSVISGDASLWLRVLHDQERSRWDSERKLMFAQAAEALRIITDEPRAVRSSCYWDPLEIEGYTTVDKRDHVIVEVRVFNPNDTDAPVAALLLQYLLTGLARIVWPPRKSIPARKSTKIRFKLRREANGAIDVKFALSRQFHG